MKAATVLKVVWAREGQRSPVLRNNGALRRETRPAVEVAFYRKYTEGMLKRYMRMAMEAGRTPSLCGQEMFRARVTHYRMRNFEDVVIFVHDVESCLKRLNETERMLLGRITLQEYTQGEVAGMTGMSLRHVNRLYLDAVDRLTEIFLRVKLLEPMKY